ncbi:Vps52-domain-containing protein [Terfezia boudieri ATCC MYA-4762]|uniref:Vps52-domain-containing protein n=1 Tax=Terfezia boudieri ATCC MYA-4762 TaxID=1051890 RepID=A0A3N4M1A2_9PEZI|nr:Vps52-domain-containing protein [Terfezia boudieri ATCC MYA-4762]
MWKPGWKGAGHPSQIGSSNGRSFSPVPVGRRRPQPTPRSSSLTMSSNTSTTSLPGTRATKRSTAAPPPVGLREPLEVLGEILGIQTMLPDSNENESHLSGTELQIEDDIDFGELSLEEYANLEEPEKFEAKPHSYNSQSVDEYEKEKDKFHDLHRSVKACDEVLKTVESYLSSFQTDLGLVSAEIETLQTRSQALNRRLENRKAVEKILGPIVEDIALAPHVVRKIAEGEINDSWIKALQEAEQKIKSVEARDPENIKAIQDVKPELDRITNKVIERVREYFVTRIKALRVPNANAQHIQQTGFLRMKELFLFMAHHSSQLTDEIAQAYINTMRWYYLSHFQRYHRSLEKLKVHIMEKYDTVGHEDLTKRSTLIPSLKSTPIIAHDPFGLGRRIETLRNREHPPLKAASIEDDKAIHYLEVPFRHFNYALMENASAEYTFITEFFSYKSYEQASIMFHQIFGPTFALGQSFTKSLVEQNMDALGIMLAVRLNNQFAFELQRRRVPVLDGYINATNMLLWPRFQIVLDAHSESLKKYNPSSALGGSRGALTSGDSKHNTAPHLLTQRFGQFLHGILALSSEAGDDEPTANRVMWITDVCENISLGRLRGDYEAFLTRLSKVLADDRKKKRFLYNNYSLVLTIISDTDGKLAAEQREHFEALKRAFRE